ncbi:hypothetical protein R1flu_007590 [Riccia fluitans]|uniref:Uncharacterized protein n=1 Tax=Riccia fluitans TaxID=41844 RepID=A0ABD1YZU7_9MARC
MNENGLTKGGLDLEQNVDDGMLFVGASSAFRNAHCPAFSVLQEKQQTIKKGRKPLNDISNWPETQQGKSASTSPVAKWSKPLNYEMEILAQQIATKVANAKVVNVNMAASGLSSFMGPAEQLSKEAGVTQNGNQELEQRHLPKVLNKASSSEAMKGKAPATESPINSKPLTYASKAAAGEQGISRSLEPRARGVDAWRAARERRNNSLRVAATSEVCIRRNRDRFQRLDNGGLEENPYPELEQQVVMTEERREEIRETFQFLRQTHAQTWTLIKLKTAN